MYGMKTVQEVDGDVIANMTDEDLGTLGVGTMGDKHHLRRFAQSSVEPSQVAPTSDRVTRKKLLVDLIRQRTPKTAFTSRRRPGRPKATTKLLEFGLRILEASDVDGKRTARTVSRPLGDKNKVKLRCDLSINYEGLLMKLTQVFFPEGKNPILGHLHEYDLEIVNDNNENVTSIQGQFTISQYIEQKHIPGSFSLYVLARPMEHTGSQEIAVQDVYFDTLPSSSYQVLAVPDHLPQEEQSQVLRYEVQPIENQESADPPPISEVLHSPQAATSGPALELLQAVAMQESQESIKENDADSHLKSALAATLQEMATCNEPVQILRNFRSNLLRGRALNISTAEEEVRGKTTAIFVNRDTLFDDSVEELLRDDIDVTVPLEVQFIGEMAADYGGPRREFLHSVLVDMMQQLFVEMSDGYVVGEDASHLYVHQRRYYVAGLLIGLSLLQEGPTPTYFKEEQIRGILLNPFTEAEKQLNAGLALLGLTELVKEKPCLLFLFVHQPSLKISYASLVRELKPVFSDEGSNQRQNEHKLYRLFLKYIKEAHAGRRGDVTLEKILQFVTGASREPLLGWDLLPSVVFQDIQLPTSNTCINRLVLPMALDLPENMFFDKLDLAFVNDFFGKM